MLAFTWRIVRGQAGAPHDGHVMVDVQKRHLCRLFAQHKEHGVEQVNHLEHVVRVDAHELQVAVVLVGRVGRTARQLKGQRVDGQFVHGLYRRFGKYKNRAWSFIEQKTAVH